MGIFKIQGCHVPQKSIFNPFGKKLPARMTVKDHLESIAVVTSSSFLCWLGGFGRIPNGSVEFFG